MRRKIICLFLLCLFCIPGVAWAQETSDEITNQNLQGQIEASGAQELSEQAPDEAKEILSQLCHCHRPNYGRYANRRFLKRSAPLFCCWEH